tara:strand:+ start:3395 stop:3556 length:162 start_codon:yes stop_codon:yes gene_type:complete
MPKIIYERDTGEQISFDIPSNMLKELTEKHDVDPWEEILTMLAKEIRKIEDSK